MMNPLDPKPKCYGAYNSISVLQVPTVGNHNWERIQQEIATLVGLMTLKESLQITNNGINILVTVLGICCHSKTSECIAMYNSPSFRDTMSRTLTLQAPKNRQHDTSLWSVQPNHQDYVLVSLGRESSSLGTTTASEYCPRFVASAEQANAYSRSSCLSNSVRMWPLHSSKQRDGHSSPHSVPCMSFCWRFDGMGQCAVGDFGWCGLYHCKLHGTHGNMRLEFPDGGPRWWPMLMREKVIGWRLSGGRCGARYRAMKVRCKNRWNRIATSKSV